MVGYCTLNTDASVKDNVGGYAIWITTDEGRIKRYGRFKVPVNDSNKAEIMAVINGIHIILQRNIKPDYLIVNTDNRTCRAVINSKLRPGSDDEFKKLAEHLIELCSKFPFVLAKKIKGHTKYKTARHHVNRWCDEYARKGRLGIKDN